MPEPAETPELFTGALAGDAGLAQSLTPGFPLSFRPALERSRFGEVPSFGSPPASGAGSTGFDSTNAQRRRLRGRAQVLKSGQSAPGKQKPGNRTGRASVAPVPERPPPGVNLPATTMQLPRRFTRRGAPDVKTTSLQNIPTTVATYRRPVPLLEDPFAPTGIRAGAFVLRPAIELSGGYDDNPTRINKLPGSSTVVVAPELMVQSDWKRHSLSANLRGSYTWYEHIYHDPLGGSFGTPENISRPSVDARINGRLDAASLSHADGEARYLITTDNPGSPNVQAGLRRFPLVTTVGGTLGYTQGFNRFEVTGKTTVDSISYQPSSLTDGTTSSNDDRNYNQYGGSLRSSYEIKPGLKPFVEGGGDARIREVVPDRSGFDRDSHALYGKVGTTFEFTRTLVGELSVGYTRREYADPRLANLEGATIDGSLIWTASPLTTLTLTATTLANEIVTPYVSGMLSRDVTFRIDHAFRRWLVATARVGFGVDDYVGSPELDHRYLASFGLAYKLNRDVQLKGEIRHDWKRSNLPNLAWDSTSVLVGMRLQR